MKNFITLLLSTAMLLPSFSTFASQPLQLKNRIPLVQKKSHPVSTQAVPFYSQDFSTGIPGTWQNIDNSGNGIYWQRTVTGTYHNNFPFVNFLSNAGTTAANGYAMFDSDSSGGVGGEDGLLVSNSIDCSGQTNVRLRFNEYFAQKNFSLAIVSVSNDGMTWFDYYHAEGGLASNQTTPNPNVVDLDISLVADNQPTVWIAFEFIGDNDYFWMVDDIQLYSIPNEDAGIISILGPVSSCSSLTNSEIVTVEIYNYGSQSLTNFYAAYKLDAQPVTAELITDTIPSNTSYLYSFIGTADLSAPGTHFLSTFTMVVSDADPSNDTLSNVLYNGSIPVNLANPYSQGFEVTAGEDFSSWAVADVNSDFVTWELATVNAYSGSYCVGYNAPLPANTSDDWLFSTCLELDAQLTYELSYWKRTLNGSSDANLEVMLCTGQDPVTAVQTLVPNALVNNTTYSQEFSSFSPASSGTYYLGWHVTNTANNCSVNLDDINLRVTNVSVNEDALAQLNVYPNPSTGLIYFTGHNLALESSEIRITDFSGRLVFLEKTSAEHGTIDLRHLAEGIYLMKISSGNNYKLTRIVITR